MLKSILRAVYPGDCVLCGAAGHQRLALCAACLADLPVNRNACVRCAEPLAVATPQALCGRCLRRPPIYDSAWSPFLYRQPLEWMIQRFKFDAKLFIGQLLAELAIQRFPSSPAGAQCIIPVPLHRQRYRERGFNQSRVLASVFSRHTGLPVDDHSCRKLRSSPPQIGSTAAERRKHVKQTFHFDNRHAYHHIVILDDVITTGSTVSEMTRIMKLAGVARVDVWSIARAPGAC